MDQLKKTSAPHSAFDLMIAHLELVTVELFAAYSTKVERSWHKSAATMPAEIAAVAAIGYVGDHMRGALTILTNESTVKAWLSGTSAGEWELGDVLGEFSNMLLGRLKGRLLREGLPILVATPISTTGSGVRLSVPLRQSKWLVFDGPEWHVGIRLDANFESEFALRAAGDREQPAEAGDTILF